MKAPPDGLLRSSNSNAEKGLGLSPRSSEAHVAELDGIRALAIWSVLVVHLFFAWPTTDQGRAFIPKALAAVLSHGWLGVDLFFVLSGFLITRTLLATKQLGTQAYFRRFYTRRVLRILPLCLAVIAVLLITFRGQYLTYFAYCAFLSANLVPANTPVPDAAGPFWSLAVEEQFYLVWPWLVLWLRPRQLMVVAGTLVVAEVFARMYTNADGVDHTFFRLDGLAMGAFVATWFSLWDGNQNRARVLAMALAGVAIAIAVIGLPFGIRYADFPNTTISQAVCIFGAIMVVVVAYSGHRALAILKAPLLTTTALLSYALYLVHRPVIDGLLALFGHASWYLQLSATQATLLRACTAVPIAYGIALLTRRFIEAPCIRLGRRA